VDHPESLYIVVHGIDYNLYVASRKKKFMGLEILIQLIKEISISWA